ncbi:MAG: hypothetical protein JNK87_31100 [Bryobacterales bacterium]|nr:hypothetical protein [Bryobacterales bacterium]
MILAIGSHSRKIGKTSVVCAIIRGTPEVRWTAIKISSNRRGLSSGFDSFEEMVASETCDTGRYLAAGATEAYWLRATDAEMDRAAAFVRILEADNRALIIESNRIVERIHPDLYTMALNYDVDDFKDSARRSFARADAYLRVRSDLRRPPRWQNVDVERLSRLPVYEVIPPDYAPSGFLMDLRSRLELPVVRESVA